MTDTKSSTTASSNSLSGMDLLLQKHAKAMGDMLASKRISVPNHKTARAVYEDDHGETYFVATNNDLAIDGKCCIPPRTSVYASCISVYPRAQVPPSP